MKRLFLPLAMLFFGACASAQVPSFKSFNPTQFSTNNFIISITNSALVTNVNNIETLFINSTNIFNLFAPASAGTTSYWTNILGTLQPTAGNIVLVTNLVSEETLKSPGAFVLPSSISSNLVAGANCIDVTYSSSVDFNGPTTTPSDATVELTLGNTQGSVLFIHNSGTNAFSMINGTPTCDGTPGAYVRLNGDWAATNRGDGLVLYFTGFIWTEIGRFQGGTNVITGDNVWENVSGNIRPVNGNANNVLSFTSGLADNATNVAMVVNTTNVWAPFGGSRFADFQSSGTNIYQFYTEGTLQIESWDGPQVIGRTKDSNNLFNLSAQPGFVFFDMYSGGTARLQMNPDVTSSGSAVAYLFDTSNVLTNGDKFVSVRNAGTEVLNISPNDTGAQIVWGPGDTNVLYRTGTDLVYTNAATTVNFSVFNSGGTGPTLLAQNTTSVLSSGGGSVLVLRNGTMNVQLFGDKLYPTTDRGISLGGTNTVNWLNGSFFGYLAVQGHESGGSPPTNYSRLLINHSGTNGTVNFQSLGAGAAGTPRDIGIFSNSTQVAGISMGGGFTQNLLSKYLAVNATVSDATLVNLSMEATVIGGKKYAFRCVLYCANSTAGDGVKIDFDGGSAASTNFRAHTKITDAALLSSTQTSALATDITAATITGDTEIEVNGSFEPSGTGTFIPRFAENSDGGGTLTVYRGSHLIMTEIP